MFDDFVKFLQFCPNGKHLQYLSLQPISRLSFCTPQQHLQSGFAFCNGLELFYPYGYLPITTEFIWSFLQNSKFQSCEIPVLSNLKVLQLQLLFSLQYNPLQMPVRENRLYRIQSSSHAITTEFIWSFLRNSKFQSQLLCPALASFCFII